MPFRLTYILFLLIACTGIEKMWGQEEGLASYYHDRFHGRRAASGRKHDSNELVAAHRTYPFGTFLRVTNLANMKSVIVCVTDRGPYRKGRIIDVSPEAAELLEFKKKGITRVRIEVVPGPLDLRYLDLIYPKVPYLETDYLRPIPPYKIKLGK
ncbi:septal ring lytic transglycosylase RlpA family protein [Parabacteroides bouchesdurhonensis]|uniref:septal ring lytic transglycosylase RlpA family protein n=1 Tax=Parabacteroides bouchesdurhonensis TaxID=1936995 RepID=UPI000C849661|nr:septal ring lytic transglycosylase RlpA family protein [Parabacteroides bouchesdurhonensis]RHJ91385.1 septal ring lytic transglycosylase RlpA family protein [Bacteroides sp. AM07-16]